MYAMFGGVPTPFLGTPFKINQLGIMQFMQFLDLYFYDWKHQSAEDVSFGDSAGVPSGIFNNQWIHETSSIRPIA